MATFSTSDINSLVAESRKHDDVLVKKELQPYNDFLYTIISQNIRARHDDIMETLKTKIRDSPTKIRAVAAPLWSYNVRYFHKTRQEYDAYMGGLTVQERMMKMAETAQCDQLYESNGWHWTIGAEFDGIPDWMSSHVYENLPPVPVDLIVRRTDLCARLSTLFHGHGWVNRVYSDILYENDECIIRKMTLMVYFYPNGLPHGFQTKAVQTAKDKYATHVNYRVQDDHRVVLRGPGLEPPQTPPSSPPATPGAPQRKRCPTCEGIEIDDE